MKILLSFFALLSFATNAYASCPDLSGKFFDQFGFYNIITQVGCEKLTWTIDNNPNTPDMEPSLPKTQEFVIDSNDYTNWIDSLEVTNYAYFSKDALVISWRKSFEYNGEWVSNYSRERLTINADKSILTQSEKDLIDEKEFRSTDVDLSFHRQYLYTRQR